MNYKDSLGDEIKKILEEDAEDLKLSFTAIENIKKNRKVTLKEKIKDLLNHEIEIPLAPALVGFVLVLGISIFPKDFQPAHKTETISFNGSQIIIIKDKGVS